MARLAGWFGIKTEGMMKTAYFAGGCFWCITPVFKENGGVLSVSSGYCGGDEANPKYEDVKAQRTHHRETLRIEYDEEKVSFGELLDIFLESVDPFDAGGQFIDRGSSYTLAIFCNDETERITAEQKLRDLAIKEGRTPAVSVEPYKIFWPAEEYHQDYYLKNPEAFEKELIESGRLSPSCPLGFRKKRLQLKAGDF